MGAIDKDIFEVMDDPKRRQRLAMLLAWRTLRQSIARGRAMSLPNVLRLYLRIAHDINVQKHQVQRGFGFLSAKYSSAIREAASDSRCARRTDGWVSPN